SRGGDGRARNEPGEWGLRARPDDSHLRRRRGVHSPLGGRRDRLGLRPRGGDRRVVGESAAAAHCGGRADRGMTLLTVAVQGRGLVEPAAPVFRADDEALLRGGVAFETVRTYDGVPFLLDRHIRRFCFSIGALAL